MYTVSHYQGYNEPLDIELLESYEGEAKEIILADFIDQGTLSETVYTIDETDEDDLELEVSDYLTLFEIATLRAIEKNVSESLWELMTVQSLKEELIMPTDERRVA